MYVRKQNPIWWNPFFIKVDLCSRTTCLCVTYLLECNIVTWMCFLSYVQIYIDTAYNLVMGVDLLLSFLLNYLATYSTFFRMHFIFHLQFKPPNPKNRAEEKKIWRKCMYMLILYRYNLNHYTYLIVHIPSWPMIVFLFSYLSSYFLKDSRSLHFRCIKYFHDGDFLSGSM